MIVKSSTRRVGEGRRLPGDLDPVPARLLSAERKIDHHAQLVHGFHRRDAEVRETGLRCFVVTITQEIPRLARKLDDSRAGGVKRIQVVDVVIDASGILEPEQDPQLSLVVAPLDVLGGQDRDQLLGLTMEASFPLRQRSPGDIETAARQAGMDGGQAAAGKDSSTAIAEYAHFQGTKRVDDERPSQEAVRKRRIPREKRGGASWQCGACARGGERGKEGSSIQIHVSPGVVTGRGRRPEREASVLNGPTRLDAMRARLFSQPGFGR